MYRIASPSLNAFATGRNPEHAAVAVTDGLVAHGVGVLRFGFRGVGESEGSHDAGRGEVEDVAAAMEYARTLAAGPSVAVDLARRFIHKSLTSNLDEMLDYEAVAAVLSAHTKDAEEGTSAFVEKRKAEFKGH